MLLRSTTAPLCSHMREGRHTSFTPPFPLLLCSHHIHCPQLTAVVKDDAAEEAGEKKATKPKPKTGGMRLDLGGQSMMPRIPCVLYFVGDHHAKILCTIPTGFHANFPVTLNYEVLGPDGMVRYKDTFGGVDVMQYEAIVDLEE